MKKLLWALAAAAALSAAPVLAQTTSPAPSSTANKNSNAAPSASTRGAGAASSASDGEKTAKSEKPGEKLDINSASAEQLRELKGVGPARAEAIIKGRPYSGKDDLARRKIVPQSVYEQIQDQIVARQKHK